MPLPHPPESKHPVAPVPNFEMAYITDTVRDAEALTFSLDCPVIIRENPQPRVFIPPIFESFVEESEHPGNLRRPGRSGRRGVSEVCNSRV